MGLVELNDAEKDLHQWEVLHGPNGALIRCERCALEGRADSEGKIWVDENLETSVVECGFAEVDDDIA